MYDTTAAAAAVVKSIYRLPLYSSVISSNIPVSDDRLSNEVRATFFFLAFL